MNQRPSGRFTAAVLLLLFTALLLPVHTSAGQTKALKTSHKRYAVYPYKDLSILCEPYQVAKNDWLYKIFRKKGEISEIDFPLFLNIFKSINPQISNIDAIQPDQQILIPLKRINSNDYKQIEPGVVDVPVIEFSSIPEIIKPFIQRHAVKDGDSVSELVDKVFINKDGSLNEKGLKAFKLANPTHDDVHRIYAGTYINLPTASLISQPWFISQMSGPEPSPPFQNQPPPDPAQIKSILENYASMVGGSLLQKGKVYFPQDTGPDLTLDLSVTPVIELENGERLLMVPPEKTDSLLIKTIKYFWPKMTLLDIQNIMQKVGTRTSNSPDPELYGTPRVLPSAHGAAVDRLLKFIGLPYTQTSTVSFSLGKINVEALVGRIARSPEPDLLLDFENIYGSAFEAIKDTGSEILSISSKETTLTMAFKLFSALGYSVVRDPALVSSKLEQTIIMQGLYITGTSKEFFVSEKALDPEAMAFLDEKGIELFYTRSADLEGQP